MAFTMITDRHNYDDGYISLVNIDLLNLPESIDVDGYTLTRKNEFHISLVCLKQLDKLYTSDVLTAKKLELKQAFLDFEKSHNLIEFELTSKYRLAKRGDKVTVVAMADVPNINELFDSLMNATGINIPTQPTHITIYTLQPEVGIGLTSSEQVENETLEIDLPVLSAVRVG